jgi:hypothetical protein
MATFSSANRPKARATVNGLPLGVPFGQAQSSDSGAIFAAKFFSILFREFSSLPAQAAAEPKVTKAPQPTQREPMAEEGCVERP